jgi:bifunctional non-homologous end joining protein LigD
LKYDGFRAIVSTEDCLQIRSRRAWNMSDRVPELRELPPGLVLDGELVAFNDAGAPHWPLVVERMLHGNTAIPLTFVAFDLLRVDGHNLTCNPWSQRRTLLEGVWVDRQCARLADVFDDGHALFDAVVSYGLEGIVAKRRAGLYRSGYRAGRSEEPGLLAARVRETKLMRRRRARLAAVR